MSDGFVSRTINGYTVAVLFDESPTGLSLAETLREVDRLANLIDTGCPDCHTPVGSVHAKTCPLYLPPGDDS